MLAPQLRDKSLNWKVVVGDWVSLYYPVRKRRTYEIWIVFDVAFSSSSAEVAVMEVMCQRTWTGIGLTKLGGGYCLE